MRISGERNRHKKHNRARKESENGRSSLFVFLVAISPVRVLLLHSCNSTGDTTQAGLFKMKFITPLPVNQFEQNAAEIAKVLHCFAPLATFCKTLCFFDPIAVVPIQNPWLPPV